MSIEEVAPATTETPVRDVADLMSWQAERQAQLWDRQIEENTEAGRFDALLAEVEKEYEAGLAQP